MLFLEKKMKSIAVSNNEVIKKIKFNHSDELILKKHFMIPENIKLAV